MVMVMTLIYLQRKPGDGDSGSGDNGDDDIGGGDIGMVILVRWYWYGDIGDGDIGDGDIGDGDIGDGDIGGGDIGDGDIGGGDIGDIILSRINYSPRVLVAAASCDRIRFPAHDRVARWLLYQPGFPHWYFISQCFTLFFSRKIRRIWMEKFKCAIFR